MYTSEYPIFSVTVDVVCLTVRRDSFQVLLVERGSDPFEGQLALPGGFVEIDEELEHAARRELQEETSIDGPYFIEQLATYGTPDRDPRGRMVSIAHLVIAPDLGEAVGGDRRGRSRVVRRARDPRRPEAARLRPPPDPRDAVDRARSKLEWSPLAPMFCPPEFTIGELRHVYETIWGQCSWTRRTSTEKVTKRRGLPRRDRRAHRPRRRPPGEALPAGRGRADPPPAQPPRDPLELAALLGRNLPHAWRDRGYRPPTDLTKGDHHER